MDDLGYSTALSESGFRFASDCIAGCVNSRFTPFVGTAGGCMRLCWDSLHSVSPGTEGAGNRLMLKKVLFVD